MSFWASPITVGTVGFLVLVLQDLDLLSQNSHSILVYGSQSHLSLKTHDLLEVLVQFVDLDELLTIPLHDLLGSNSKVYKLEHV